MKPSHCIFVTQVEILNTTNIKSSHCSDVKNFPGCFLEFLSLLISFSPLTAFVFEATLETLSLKHFGSIVDIQCTAFVSVSGNKKSCF